MPKKIVATFKVEHLQVMDEQGKVDKALMPNLSPDQIKYLYETMVFARKFDEKMLSLQRQGRIGTFAQIKGQEASTVGSAYALEKTDWMVPCFRENASYIVRGLPPENILLYYGGSEYGNKIPEGERDLPVAVPVGTQALHAVGIAMAITIKNEKNAVLTYFGDGATSEGDVNEAINFAGVFKAPVVFFNQNNQWAISIPRTKQTAAQTLAQKAIAGGVTGIQIDGNDVFAVYKATKDALEKIRKGNGPVYIESLTYRFGDHTTADDATRYRTDKELQEWMKKDPILRLQKYMKSKKMWSEIYENQVQKKADTAIEETLKRFDATPPSQLEDIFKYTYKEMTGELKEELESLQNHLKTLTTNAKP